MLEHSHARPRPTQQRASPGFGPCASQHLGSRMAASAGEHMAPRRIAFVLGAVALGGLSLGAGQESAST
jgi:hypothetical protein